MRRTVPGCWLATQPDRGSDVVDMDADLVPAAGSSRPGAPTCWGPPAYIATGALQVAGLIKLLDGDTAKVGFASGSKAFGHRYLLSFCEERGLARAVVSKL